MKEQKLKQMSEAEENGGKGGAFLNFVLLKEAKWDKARFLQYMEEEWKIKSDPEAEEEEREDLAVISYKGYTLAVMLVEAPVPDGEAEYHAQSNYRWRSAVEVTKTHQAHIMVAVMGKPEQPKPAGELLVKAVVACCQSANVVGIYGSETVFEPAFYLRFADLLKEGIYPLFNLVWIGMYKSDNGFSGYTSGLRAFGKEEIEVIDSKAEPNKLCEFLSDITNYVIEYDALLLDGQTIGFSEDEKLPITLSEGVAVEGDSLKIGFCTE